MSQTFERSIEIGSKGYDRRRSCCRAGFSLRRADRMVPGVNRRAEAMNPRVVLLRREHAVPDQHVQMDVEIDRTAESLDQRDDPGARAAGRTEAPAFAGERNGELVAATVTPHWHSPVLQPAAAQIVL